MPELMLESCFRGNLTEARPKPSLFTGGPKVLVVQGYFENGVFIPKEPVLNMKGRREATLTIQESDGEKERQIKMWTEILEDLRNCDEELAGEPERIHLRTPEEIDIL